MPCRLALLALLALAVLAAPAARADVTFDITDPGLRIRDEGAPALIIGTTGGDTRLLGGATLRVHVNPGKFAVIPSWDTSVTTVSVTGGRISNTVAYDGDDVVLTLTEDFAPGDTVTVDGLRLLNLNEPGYYAMVLSTDDGAGILSNSFEVTGPDVPTRVELASPLQAILSDAPNPPMTLTVRGSEPFSVLRAGDEILLFADGMQWDTAVTSVTLGGDEPFSFSPTVTYRDGGLTAVLQVTGDVSAFSQTTVTGLVPVAQTDSPIRGVRLRTVAIDSSNGAVSLGTLHLQKRGEAFSASLDPTCGGTGGSQELAIPVAGAPYPSGRLHIYFAGPDFPADTDSRTITLIEPDGTEHLLATVGAITNFFTGGSSKVGEYAIPDPAMLDSDGTYRVRIDEAAGTRCSNPVEASMILGDGPAAVPEITLLQLDAGFVNGCDTVTATVTTQHPDSFPSLLYITLEGENGELLTSALRSISTSPGQLVTTVPLPLSQPIGRAGSLKIRATLSRTGDLFANASPISSAAEEPITVGEFWYVVTTGPDRTRFIPFSLNADGVQQHTLHVRVAGPPTSFPNSVRADFSALEGGLGTVELFDDGNPPDSAAGDGVYTINGLICTADSGTLTVPITVETSFPITLGAPTCTTNIAVQAFAFARPNFASLAFDPIAIPNNSVATTTLRARVTDPQGVGTVTAVEADLRALNFTAFGALDFQPLTLVDPVQGIWERTGITTNAPPGTYQIPVRAFDSTGRQVRRNATLTVDDAFVRNLFADAGPDQEVNEGTVATLDGTGSRDELGEPFTFHWAQLSGPTVKLLGADTAQPTFAVPNLTANATAVFQLVVVSSTRPESDLDTVQVTILASDDPPVFTALPQADPPTIFEGETSALSAAASAIDQGQSVTIEWQSLGIGTVSPATGNASQFQAPATVPADTTATIRATARDSGNLTASRDLAITVRAKADLRTTTATLPSEARTGQAFPMSWSVTNGGPGTADALWEDRVYLSADATLDAGDLRLAAVPRPSTLAPGASYTRSFAVTMPSSVVPGTYRVFVVADESGAQKDRNAANNVLLVGDLPVFETPCPDLIVTQVTLPPGPLRAGGTASFDWRIENAGNGSTNVPFWRDRLYLAFTSNPADPNRFAIGTFTNPTALNPGQGYTASKEVSLPRGISGDLFLHVETDVDRAMGECNDANNIAVSATTVTVQPFSPPLLRVTDLELLTPDPLRGETVTVRWRAANEGVLPTGPIRFAHDITARRLPAGPTLLAAGQQGITDTNLLPGAQTPLLTSTFALPQGVWGPTRLRVTPVITVGSNVEVAAQEIEIMIQTGLPSDLEPEWIASPATALSGQRETFSFKVTNVSSEPTLASRWTDEIWLSRDADFETAGDNILIATFERFGGLDGGGKANYRRDASVELPADADGIYHVFVRTDALDVEFEDIFEANNILRAPTTLAVTFAPPNLVVEDVQVTAPGGAPLAVPALSGTPAEVRYRIRNAGTGATNRTTRESARLSGGGPGSIEVAARNRGVMAPGETEDVATPFVIPVAFEAPTAIVTVSADFNTVMFESDKTDNSSASEPFMVVPNLPDLVPAISSFGQGSDPGKTLRINATVINKGGRASGIAWTDRFYLSADRFLDAGDLLLAESAHPATNLSSGGALSIGPIEAAVPAGLTGRFHLIMETDGANAIAELSDSNNVTSSVSALRVGDLCDPDLDYLALSAPAEAVTGQTLEVTRTLRNSGTARTEAARVRETYYLSLDQFLDPGTDIAIGTRATVQRLGAGEQLDQPISLTIPAGVLGPHYVIAVADPLDEECETDEDNNIAVTATTVDIEAVPPANLVVTSVSAPASAVLGTQVAISWEVTNTVGSTYGSWTDNVYLSKDATWSADDVLVGSAEVSFPKAAPLGPGGTYTRILSDTVNGTTTELPGVSPGDYFVIVRADARNVVVETDDANDLASAAPLAVEVEELPLGVPVPITIARNRERYFRFSAEEGASVRIMYDADDNRAVNEIYVRSGEVPTRTLFDVRNEDLLDADPVVIVPRVSAEEQFLLIRPERIPIGNSTSGRLTAEVIPYGVAYIEPNRVSNAGVVIFELLGSQIDGETTYTLSLPSATQFIEGRFPVGGKRVSANRQLVAFDMRGLAPGFYDFWSATAHIFWDRDDSDPASPWFFRGEFAGIQRLERAIEVTPGIGPRLLARLSTSPFTRFNSVVPVTLEVRNTGDANAPAPFVEIYTSDLSPPMLRRAGLSTEELEGYTRRQFYLPGPLDPAVFAPGENATVEFYVRNLALGGTRLRYSARILRDRDTVIDWASRQAGIRNAGIPDEQWAFVWQEFLARVGTTQGELHDALRPIAESLARDERDRSIAPRRTGSAPKPIETRFLVERLVDEIRLELFPEEEPALLRPAPIAIGDEAAAPLRGGTFDPQCEECTTPFLVLKALEAGAIEGSLFVGLLTSVIGVVDYTSLFGGGFQGLGASALFMIHFVTGNGQSIFVEYPSDIMGSLFSKLENPNGQIAGSVKPLIERRIREQRLGHGLLCNRPVAYRIEDLLTEQERTLLGFDTSQFLQLSLAIGNVPGQNQPPPIVTGKVILTKLCNSRQECSSVRVKVIPRVQVTDVFDFCPGTGRGQGSLSDLVMTAVQQMEVCGVGKEYRVHFDVEMQRITFTMNCQETGADWADPDSEESRAARRALGNRRTPPSRRPSDGASCTGCGNDGASGDGPDPPSDAAAEQVVVASRDPNDITGPAGFGEERFVALNQPMEYRIRFENVAEATSPAQVVTIENPLPPGLDIRRFALGSFGWSGREFPIPPNRSVYSTTIDLSEERGILVRVRARVDLETRTALWEFTSLDPATGEIPADATLGFLPPNAESPEGEGFVTYTMRPLPGSRTGDLVENSAVIVFDDNEPIATNVTFNTIDADIPASEVLPIAPPAPGDPATIAWQASDAPGGSGIAAVTLFMRENGGLYTEVGRFGPDTMSTEFTPAANRLYEFFTVATDNAGNAEAFPPGPDQQLQVGRTGAAVALSNPALDFGRRIALLDSGTVQRTLRISSIGDATLIIDAAPVPLSGSHPEDWSTTPLPTSIEPGSFADVTVTYTPGGVGARSAVLSFATNDAINETVEVPLAAQLEAPPDLWILY